MVNILIMKGIYRNIYVKGYKKFPYQKLTGFITLMYTGKIITGVQQKPDGFDDKLDLYIDCDCDYSKWRTLKKVFKN